jgi:transcriptional regulator with XRE-family HTH domain
MVAKSRRPPPKRERVILNLRSQDWTLEEVGAQVGLVKERVRELEEQAVRTLLADASGVTQQAISALESGSVSLGPDRALKLALALHVHPAVLMFSGLGACGSAGAGSCSQRCSPRPGSW